jgi:hypothetical protein
MSDDDLWRPKDSGERADGEEPPPEEAAEGVSDETQPITGTPSAPPPTPQGPSYQPPAGPGAVPPPQNPYGQNPYGQNPSGQPPNQPPNQPWSQQQNPYGGQLYTPPPNPYQPQGGYVAPQGPYGSAYQPAYAGGGPPQHPSATTSMVLGIIGLVGIAICGGVTLVLSPAAGVVGAKAVREIDASGGQYAGRDRAQAGKIMGIIGTVLLILGIVAIVAAVVLLIAFGDSDSSPVTPITPNPTFQNG